MVEEINCVLKIASVHYEIHSHTRRSVSASIHSVLSTRSQHSEVFRTNWIMTEIPDFGISGYRKRQE